MNIAFVYANGRAERYAETVQGLAATEFFYGAVELEKRGHSIKHYEIGNGEITAFWHKIAEQLYRWRMSPTRTNGSILAELYPMCSSMDKQDVIVATTTASAFSLATLKLFGFVHRPIVAIHCGIANFELPWLRRQLNTLALRNMWTQLFGEGELRLIERYYAIPDSRIEVNQFGVDTKFWTPGSGEGSYILAVGNDERRDYELLLQAAMEVDEEFKIVTRLQMKGVVPANVEIIKGGWHEQALTDERLRELYRNASMIVIPLKNSPQPSGQSVCLQAMACAKPVVLTRTDGLWSNTMIREGRNVKFVSPENKDDLVSAMLHLCKDVEMRRQLGTCARQTATEEGNIENFAKRLEKRCQLTLKLISGSKT